MKIKTLGVLVILLPLLATGCKQANTPTVEVPSVPEIEVPEIDLIEIDVSLLALENIKPELDNNYLITGNGWKVANGYGIDGTRAITILSKGGLSISEAIIDLLVFPEEILETITLAYVKSPEQIKIFPKEGYYFSNREEYLYIDWKTLEGEFIVETEGDFGKVLESLGSQTGDITIDLADSITNTDASGNKIPFEVKGDAEGKPLNVTLESGKEGGAQVNGGGILTSLIVSGANTTVTVGEGITINGGYKDASKENDNGGGVTVKDGATFILDGGTIEGNFSEVNDYTKGGGAVSILNGTFIMNSGTIRNNTAFRGAGVYIHSVTADTVEKKNASTFIMNGGSIENNTTIIEKDGTINAATGGGSGVFVYGHNAYFIMGKEASSDGSVPTIKGNVASRMGSAITLSTNGSATIYNGLITENIGAYGVIGMAAVGTLNMHGGQIINNMYGPTLDDGSPDALRISLVDVPQIRGYIKNGETEIPYSIVANHSGNLLSGTIDWDKVVIEGAGPKEVEPAEPTDESQ